MIMLVLVIHKTDKINPVAKTLCLLHQDKSFEVTTGL